MTPPYDNNPADQHTDRTGQTHWIMNVKRPPC